MEKIAGLLGACLLATSAQAEVHVFVQEANGLAWIRYACTAGEVVRAFALDVTVDRGQIVGVSDFFVGPSTPQAQGYGIFPSSFRNRVTVLSGTNVNWSVSGYTPVANAADSAGDTLPGLNSKGVTLEFGALWDTTLQAAVPNSAGTLCALQLSEAAYVSVAANLSRGGIVSAFPDVIATPVFTGALVGPAILRATVANGIMSITFQGGELETANAFDGAWVGTGNTNGVFTAPTGAVQRKFYRVRRD